MDVIIFDMSGNFDLFNITKVQDNAAHLQHRGQDELSKAYDLRADLLRHADFLGGADGHYCLCRVVALGAGLWLEDLERLSFADRRTDETAETTTSRSSTTSSI